MVWIIDQSETATGAHAELFSKTIIQRDDASPGPVVVKVEGAFIGIGNSLLIQNGATLDLDGPVLSAGSDVLVRNGGFLDITGPAQIGVGGNINIGHAGTVELGSSIGLDAHSRINFIGPDATLIVAPAAQGHVLSPSSAGNVAEFGATDTIDMLCVRGVTHATWSQNAVQKLLGFGEVQLFNAQNIEVGSISLIGSYRTANFAVSADHNGGTDITFVAAHA